MTIAELIIDSSKKAINFQTDEGSMPAGHNGPYNDNETPVRNTSHWLITFAKSYELTDDSIFLDAVQKTANYLISAETRPFKYSFFHRKNSQLDSCNGLIGQAWTIEALVIASTVLNETKYLEIAEEVFLLHTFNDEYGLWNRLEIDGTIKTIDSTFNHQLWFAACAAQINYKKKTECDTIISRFISCLPNNMYVFDEGLIFHPIKNEELLIDIYENQPFINYIKIKIKEVINNLTHSKNELKRLEMEKNSKMIYKSVGYHHFNMYAFALLKNQFPSNNYWNNSEFNSTIKYLMGDHYKDELENNSFGYSYNPPGFEIPYALEILCNLKIDELFDISTYWIDKQIKKCYNSYTKMMDRNTLDSFTHSARLYELTRFGNLNLKIST